MIQHMSLILVSILILPFYCRGASFFQANSSQCLYLNNPERIATCQTLSISDCPSQRDDSTRNIVFTSASSIGSVNVIPGVSRDFSWKVNPSSRHIGHAALNLCLDSSQQRLSACPCNVTSSQQWDLTALQTGTLRSSSGTCFGLSLDVTTPCPVSSWTTLNEFSDGVTFESISANSTPTTLLVGRYPASKIASTGDLLVTIPPGFELTITTSSGSTQVLTADQVISLSKLDTVQIQQLPGAIIYKNSGFMGPSFFVSNASNLSSLPFTASQSFRTYNATQMGVVFNQKTINLDGAYFYMSVDLGTNVSMSSICQNSCASGGMCFNATCICKPGFSGKKCDQCAPGFFGPNCTACPSCNNSTSTCDDGMFGTGTCRCNPGFTGSNCSTCLPGYFGKSCQPCNCNGRGTCDIITGKCTCASPWTSSNCASCLSPGFTAATNNTCIRCGPGCTQCDASGTCHKCAQGLVMNAANNQCVPAALATASSGNGSVCSTGQFQVSAGACSQCDSTCNTCFGANASECLSCKAGSSYFLAGYCVGILADGSGQCQPAGISGVSGQFIANNVLSTCDPCPINCQSCNIPNFSTSSLISQAQCTSCIPGYFLNDGQCVSNCPNGKFADASTNNTCTACNSTCATCSSATQCTSCANTGKVLHKGNCVDSSTCTQQGFFIANNTCQECHADCQSCSGSGVNQCTSCPSSRPFLYSGQCLPSCPAGSVVSDNQQCRQCDSSCATCSGTTSSQCLSCSDASKVAINGVCTGSCPNSNQFVVPSEGACLPILLNRSANGNPSGISRRFGWQYILLLSLLVLALILVIVCILRRRARKIRVQKTSEFAQRFENNRVQARFINHEQVNTNGTPGEWEGRQKAWSMSEKSEQQSRPSFARRFLFLNRGLNRSWNPMKWFNRKS